MTDLSVDIKLSGPLFQPGIIDNKLRQHLRGAVSELTDKGAEEARRIARFFSYPSSTLRRTGRYRRAIRGRMGKRLRGRVMVGAAEGVKHYRTVIERGRYWRSTGTRFKGYRTIYRARKTIEPQVGPIVQRHARKLVRDLT